jgi:hypothetical protein
MRATLSVDMADELSQIPFRDRHPAQPYFGGTEQQAGVGMEQEGVIVDGTVRPKKHER